MKNDKEIMKDDMVTKLAILLFESGKASTMTEALDIVINSETYACLLLAVPGWSTKQRYIIRVHVMSTISCSTN